MGRAQLFRLCLLWGFFLRTARTAVAIDSCNKNHNKLILNGLVFGPSHFYEMLCFQFLLSPMIWGGKRLFLKALFLSPLLLTLTFRQFLQFTAESMVAEAIISVQIICKSVSSLLNFCFSILHIGLFL